MIDLTDRVVLITGAAGGIGAATARTVEGRRRARRAARAARRGPRGGARRGARRPRGHVVTGDLAKPAGAERIWREAHEWTGRVDVLVNNAGIYEVADPDGDLDAFLASWERTLAICLVSPAVLCREAIKTFREQESGGIIINLASRAAFRGEDPEYWHYAAAKAGVVAMTRTIARQYGRDGVTAFAVVTGIRQHPVQRRAGRALRARLLRAGHGTRRGRRPAGPGERDRVPRVRPRPPRHRDHDRRQRRELCPLTRLRRWPMRRRRASATSRCSSTAPGARAPEAAST